MPKRLATTDIFCSILFLEGPDQACYNFLTCICQVFIRWLSPHRPSDRSTNITLAMLGNIITFYTEQGSGVVQWSAQKLATPRVEGLNPDRSVIFCCKHCSSNCETRHEDPEREENCEENCDDLVKTKIFTTWKSRTH